MNVEQMVKAMPDGPFEVAINGITFSGKKNGDTLTVLKVEVKPEKVKDIVLAHINAIGVLTAHLTYHEFKEHRPDYDSYQFDGIVFEQQKQ